MNYKNSKHGLFLKSEGDCDQAEKTGVNAADGQEMGGVVLLQSPKFVR